MLEERLNYQLIRSINKDITDLLTYEKAIKEYAAKNIGRQAHPWNSYLWDKNTLYNNGCSVSPTPKKLPRVRSWISSSSAQAPAPDLAESPIYTVHGNTAQILSTSGWIQTRTYDLLFHTSVPLQVAAFFFSFEEWINK